MEQEDVVHSLGLDLNDPEKYLVAHDLQESASKFLTRQASIIDDIYGSYASPNCLSSVRKNSDIEEELSETERVRILNTFITTDYANENCAYWKSTSFPDSFCFGTQPQDSWRRHIDALFYQPKLDGENLDPSETEVKQDIDETFALEELSGCLRQTIEDEDSDVMRLLRSASESEFARRNPDKIRKFPSYSVSPYGVKPCSSRNRFFDYFETGLENSTGDSNYWTDWPDEGPLGRNLSMSASMRRLSMDSCFDRNLIRSEFRRPCSSVATFRDPDYEVPHQYLDAKIRKHASFDDERVVLKLPKSKLHLDHGEVYNPSKKLTYYLNSVNNSKEYPTRRKKQKKRNENSPRRKSNAKSSSPPRKASAACVATAKSEGETNAAENEEAPTVDISTIDPEILAKIPLDDEGNLTSVGSIGHGEGNCKACAFFHNPLKTCRNAIACQFCHFYHEPKKRQRMSKKKRAELRGTKVFEEGKSTEEKSEGQDTTITSGEGSDGNAKSDKRKSYQSNRMASSISHNGLLDFVENPIDMEKLTRNNKKQNAQMSYSNYSDKKYSDSAVGGQFSSRVKSHRTDHALRQFLLTPDYPQNRRMDSSPSRSTNRSLERDCSHPGVQNAHRLLNSSKSPIRMPMSGSTHYSDTWDRDNLHSGMPYNRLKSHQQFLTSPVPSSMGPMQKMYGLDDYRMRRMEHLMPVDHRRGMEQLLPVDVYNDRLAEYHGGYLMPNVNWNDSLVPSNSHMVNRSSSFDARWSNGSLREQRQDRATLEKQSLTYSGLPIPIGFR